MGTLRSDGFCYNYCSDEVTFCGSSLSSSVYKILGKKRHSFELTSFKLN